MVTLDIFHYITISVNTQFWLDARRWIFLYNRSTFGKVKPNHHSKLIRCLQFAKERPNASSVIWVKQVFIFINHDFVNLFAFKNCKNCPKIVQTQQLGEKGLGKRGVQEPNGHSGWVPAILCGEGRNFQKGNHYCNTSPIRALWQSELTEASPQWKTRESPLGVWKKSTVRNKIL